MKVAELKRIPPPKPVEPKLCACCKAFRAECEAPVGEGSAPMCWLCAHHVVEHGVELAKAPEARCECTPDMIYPDRVRIVDEHGHEIDPSCVRFVHGDVTAEQIKNATHEVVHLFNHKTKNIDRIEIPFKRVLNEPSPTVWPTPVRQHLVDEARAKVEALTAAERKLLRDSTKNPKRCN